MRVLVCGGRDFDDWESLHLALSANILMNHDEEDVTLIQGGAVGADFLAKAWAKWVGIAIEEYKADWKKHGNRAGPIRNQQMLDEGKPDLVVAFPGGTGTKDMVTRSKKAGIKVIEVG